MRRYLAVDCGSTTTKVTLFTEQPDGEFVLAAKAEVPTTVEAPVEDVTLGVRSAIKDIERQLSLTLLAAEGVITVRCGRAGVDGFYATSSAGGGLQMIVAGVMKNLTAESAERAALGAGAIVMDVIAIDDGRLPHERLERIYEMRPDMVLISGGVDGGNMTHVVQLGELFYAAGVKPRLAPNSRLPLIFAGNKEARKYIVDILGEKVDLHVVENLRPVMDKENSAPARAEIQDAFMNHVMLHAPQYRNLTKWVSEPILPTPTAVGLALTRLAREQQVNLLACDIGGATTDIFSVLHGELHRTVSANLGMSYSINNVLVQAGIAEIMAHLPFPLDVDELQDLVANKMVRPTSLPEMMSDLLVEHAVARQAISLSLEQHKQLITGLKGVRKRRSFSDFFEQNVGSYRSLETMDIDVIVGSGSVLSLAPRPQQACLILIDAFQPQGITTLLLDSQFLLPHIGAISRAQPEIAWQLLQHTSITNLGTCIAPVGPPASNSTVLAKVTVYDSDGQLRTAMYVRTGELNTLPLPAREEYRVVVSPLGGYDVGAGSGRQVEKVIRPGLLGLLLDGRGRPITVPADPLQRYRWILDAYTRCQAYEPESIAHFASWGGVARA